MTKRILTILLALTILVPAPALALSEDQKKAYDEDARYVEVEDVTLCRGGGTVNLEGNGNKEQIWNFLISQGLTPPQVAGIMGNLRAESGENFDPQIVEGGWGFPARMTSIPPPIGEHGEPGYGIAQWTTPSRKQGLQDTANTQHKSPSELAVQLAWLWKEFTENYSGTYQAVRGLSDAGEVSNIFGRQYEGYGTNTEALRAQYARTILSELGSLTPPSGNTAPDAQPSGDTQCSSSAQNSNNQ